MLRAAATEVDLEEANRQGILRDSRWPKRHRGYSTENEQNAQLTRRGIKLGVWVLRRRYSIQPRKAAAPRPRIVEGT